MSQSSDLNNQIHQLSKHFSELSFKFSGNHAQWPTAKSQILVKLAGAKLSKFIQSPTSSNVQTDLDDAAKCWSIIMQMLAGPILVQIQTATLTDENSMDPYKLWQLLCNKYEKVNTDLVFAIQTEINATILQENESLESYKARLDQNFMKLDSMCEYNIIKREDGKEEKVITHPHAVSEANKIFHFQKGIPTSMAQYEMIKTIYHILPVSSLQYEEFCQSFINKELQNKALDQSMNNNIINMVRQNQHQSYQPNRNFNPNRNNGYQQSYRNQGQYGNKNNVNFGATNNGYNGNNAPINSGSNEGSTGSNSNIVCRCCGASGHTREVCRHQRQVCHYCSKSGHIARACQLKAKQNGNNRAFASITQPIPTDQMETQYQQYQPSPSTPIYQMNTHYNNSNASAATNLPSQTGIGSVHQWSPQPTERRVNMIRFQTVDETNNSINCDNTDQQQQTEILNESDSTTEIVRINTSVLSCHATSTQSLENTIVIDSGATHHVVCNSGLLKNINNIKPVNIKGFNNSSITINQGGDLVVNNNPNVHGQIVFQEVSLVPQAATNLLSVSQICKSGGGLIVVFDSEEATVLEKQTNRVVMKFKNINDLYMLQLNANMNMNDSQQQMMKHVPQLLQVTSVASEYDIKTNSESTSSDTTPINENDVPSNSYSTHLAALQQYLLQLHHQLSHPSMSKMKQIILSGCIDGVKQFSRSDIEAALAYNGGIKCEHCIMGKTNRLPFHKNIPEQYHAQRILHRLHMDLSGPVKLPPNEYVRGIDHFPYLLSIEDEYSRRLFVCPLKHKSDAAKSIKEWLTMIQNSTGLSVIEVHSDNGTEFKNNELMEYFRAHGIQFTTSNPYTPQQNSLVERSHRTIFEKIRCMLSSAGLPGCFWWYAAGVAAYAYNTTPHSKFNNQSTPHEQWYQQKFDIDKLKVFGCTAFVHVFKHDRTKVAPKAMKCFFVGYQESQRSYILYSPELQKVIISRDVTFDMNDFSVARQFGNHDTVQVSKLALDTLIQQLGGVIQSTVTSESSISSISTDSNNTNTGGSGISYSDNQYAPLVELDEVHIDGSGEQGEINELNSINNNIDVNGNNESVEQTGILESISAAPLPEPSEFSLDEMKMNSNDYRVISREIDREEQHQFDNPTILPTRLRTRGRAADPHVNLSINYNMVSNTEDGHLSTLIPVQVDIDSLGPEPITIQQAWNDPVEGAAWKQATDNEIASLKQNEVWDLVELPIGCNVVKSKWVLRRKLNEHGQIAKHKARLVACGYSQTDGVDYNGDSIYAPVGKYKSIRLILALAVHNKYELYQLDINTAFLNAKVEETIFVHQAPGYIVRNSNGVPLVCKLRRALYGIKQAPANWNVAINDLLVNQLHFTRTISDSCVYVRDSATKHKMFLFLFVDDIVVCVHPNDVEEWNELKMKINSKYTIEDLGLCNWVLQMNIKRMTDGSIQLNQNVYINKLLQKYRMNDCTNVSTPITSEKLLKRITNNPTSVEQYDGIDSQMYSSLIGGLLYAALSTRIDISFAVGCLTRFMADPTRQHFIAAKRVLRYLSNSNISSLGIVFKPNYDIPIQTFIVTAYSDSDWAGDINDRKSISGFVIKVNDNPVSWSSKKQKTVATSTAEAEYVALVATVKEVMWYRSLLTELGYDQSEPSIIYVDNRAAISITQHEYIHEKSKHIAISLHFIRDIIASGQIKVQYIPTGDQEADWLTKALPTTTFVKIRNQLME